MDSTDAHPASRRKISPRGDFIAGLLWIILGLATVAGSWRMDRLEKQDINPYTVPGLLPGFLGAAIVLFGLLMLFRAWRQGALESRGEPAGDAGEASEAGRLWTVLALCLGFGIGLVGHGLPFWAAAAIFIAVTTSVLQFRERAANGQLARGLIVASVIGVSAGIIITLVFQELFLVRLP